MAGRFSKMKVDDLKTEIKRLTDEVNTEIRKYRSNENDGFYINENIERLKLYGGKGRNGNEVGYGLKGKKKEELVRQARELEYFSGLGINTMAGQLELESKYQKSYESFRESVDVTKEEYRDIVESFGALGKEIVGKYDSFSIADAYSERGKNVNLAKLMKQTLEEHKGEGLNQKQLTDILIDKIREEV